LVFSNRITKTVLTDERPDCYDAGLAGITDTAMSNETASKSFDRRARRITG